MVDRLLIFSKMTRANDCVLQLFFNNNQPLESFLSPFDNVLVFINIILKLTVCLFDI